MGQRDFRELRGVMENMGKEKRQGGWTGGGGGGRSQRSQCGQTQAVPRVGAFLSGRA